LQFLARDSMLYRAICYLSVRLYVTRVYQSNTAKVRIMQPSPLSSPMTLAFWR